MKRPLLALLLALAPASAQLSSLLRTVRAEVKPDQAMDDMRRIWETDRWFTFPKFDETSRNVAAMLRRAGLDQVEIVQPPADGATQYGYWTTPLAWDAKQATLDILEPEPLPLCDYQKTPTCLGMWSGPTPPEGITAEIVLDSAADFQGKLVLTDRNPDFKFDHNVYG